MIGILSPAAASVLLALFALSALASIDPRTVPASERIARANRLLDAQAGPNAAEHYRAASKVLVLSYDLVGPEASDIERRPFERMNDNLRALVMREDWPSDLEMPVNEWLSRNEATLAALEKATACERYFEPLKSESGRLADISVGLDGGMGRQAFQLVALKAAGEARANRWDAALQWNRRLLRMATHQRWSGNPMSEMIALRSEEEALTQQRAFLRRSMAADASRLRRLLADESELHPDQRILDDLGLFYDWDLVESIYDWAADPVKHKNREDLLKFMVGPERDSMSEFVGTQTRFASLDDLRQALRGSSLDKAWNATEELHRVLREWRAQPFDAAWRDRERFRERYCAAVQRDPALSVMIPCDGLVAMDSLTATHQTRAMQRSATEALLAILQHRQSSRKLPEQWDALAPKLLKEPPMDIFSGKPLVYRLSDDKKDFTLYSIGWNQVDDGGRDDRADPNADDLIYWPPHRPEWLP